MPKREEIKPHDGTVRSFASQLMFVDIMIREKMSALIAIQRFHEISIHDKLTTREAKRQLDVILERPRQPIPHPLRVLLAGALDIECPGLNEIPSSLQAMREYPL